MGGRDRLTVKPAARYGEKQVVARLYLPGYRL
jgi:hypothetical protein